jgi:ubiquinone biosynthesis protein COQ9
MDIEKTRDSLLLATLPHVMFDGWRWTAVRAGAADAGISEVDALNAFPNGAEEVLEYFSHWADRRMLEELDKRGLDEMRVRDRVALAVRTRLEILEPHREAVRRGLSAFAFPQNSALGLKCLYRSVDAIWYACGDTSTDYNFYTKRLLLAGVLSSTLIYWLDDSSEHHADTWDFLDRRIDEVLKIGGRMGKALKSVLDFPDRLVKMGPRRRRRHTRRERGPLSEAAAEAERGDLPNAEG